MGCGGGSRNMYSSILRLLHLLFNYIFTNNAHLASQKIDIGNDTIMHCWSPQKRDPALPDLLLIHGFGLTALWQCCLTIGKVSELARHYNVYVPDLVHFGESHSHSHSHSQPTDEHFQARCLVALMDGLGVSQMTVVGLGYGGLVAYVMTTIYPERVEKLVLFYTRVIMDDDQEYVKVCDHIEAIERLFLPTLYKKKNLSSQFELRLKHKFNRICQIVASAILPRSCPEDLKEQVQNYMSRSMEEQRKIFLSLANKETLWNLLPKLTQPIWIIRRPYDDCLFIPAELTGRIQRILKGNNVELIITENCELTYLEKRKALRNLQ